MSAKSNDFSNPFTPTVNMMCGCTIDNLFWPQANFSVVAALWPSGTAQLEYSGPSQFSANIPAGKVVMRVVAVEVINGNTGVWSQPWAAEGKGPPTPGA